MAVLSLKVRETINKYENPRRINPTEELSNVQPKNDNLEKPLIMPATTYIIGTIAIKLPIYLAGLGKSSDPEYNP